MGSEKANRRDFLKAAAAATVSAIPVARAESQTASAHGAGADRMALDILRRPDHVSALFGLKDVRRMQYASLAWICPGVRVSAEPVQVGSQSEIPISLTSDGNDLTYIHVRWEGSESAGSLCLGDHWERSYGDLEWRGTVPDRVMPWYFQTSSMEIASMDTG